MKKQVKQTNGITLIALVITIIVLLILAGVTIASLTGENGLLQRASNAKVGTEKAQIREELQMAVMESLFNTNGDYTVSAVITKLQQLGASATASGNSINGSYKGYNFTIDSDRNVSMGNKNANKTNYSDKLLAYFNSEDSYDENDALIDNNALGVMARDVNDVTYSEEDYDVIYYYYLNSIYKVKHIYSTEPNPNTGGYAPIGATYVEMIDSNFELKFGEYMIEGMDILYVPNQGSYKKSTSIYVNSLTIYEYLFLAEDSGYYYTDGGNIDYNRPFIGYAVKDWNGTRYYDLSGNEINEDISIVM